MHLRMLAFAVFTWALRRSQPLDGPVHDQGRLSTA